MHLKNLKKRNSKRKMHKMKYNCKNCNYHWEGNSDTFGKVLSHEKTHLKKDLAHANTVLIKLLN
jgi:transposase-like protein